eukprot:snap_masked-scaffold347_size200506-processed-gene-1.2 protein:Tk02332 transcript:snap_masked-scaffold347_size200506-processed-gene-1.2-mRNA-1 annotation:"ubiquitin-protein e3"
MKHLSMECPPTPPILTRSDTPPPKAAAVEPLSNVGGNSPRGGDSPDPHCAICLGHLENMSYTDSCLHKFCFTCLLEWSKVKPECPLCKAQFKSIIHNIQADDNYDSYTIPPPVPRPTGIASGPGGVGDYLQRVRETLRFQGQMAVGQWGMEAAVLPTLPDNFFPGAHGAAGVGAGLMWRRRRHVATSEFRRDVYQRHLFVDPSSVGDLLTGRYRECSPAWYRNNQATTHRLVPWLNRELNVVMEEQRTRTAHVLQLIVDLIQEHEIQSREFHQALRPFAGAYTEHFQHEFYHFARSYYDMVGYDRNAIYTEQRLPPARLEADTRPLAHDPPTMTIESSSEDDDIMIVDEVRTEPHSHHARETLTDRIRRRLQRHGTLGSMPLPGQIFTDASPLPLRVEGPSTSSGEARWLVPKTDHDHDDQSGDTEDNVDVVCVIPVKSDRSPLLVNISDDERERAQRVEASRIEISSESESAAIEPCRGRKSKKLPTSSDSDRPLRKCKGKGKGKGKSSKPKGGEVAPSTKMVVKSERRGSGPKGAKKPSPGSDTFTESSTSEPQITVKHRPKTKKTCRRRKSLRERNSRSRRKDPSTSSSSELNSDEEDDDNPCRKASHKGFRSQPGGRPRLVLPTRKRRSSNYFGSSDEASTSRKSSQLPATSPRRTVQFCYEPNPVPNSFSISSHEGRPSSSSHSGRKRELPTTSGLTPKSKRRVTLIQPQAVMDQTPLDGFKVESMNTNDLRLKLINRKLREEIQREENRIGLGDKARGRKRIKIFCSPTSTPASGAPAAATAATTSGSTATPTSTATTEATAPTGTAPSATTASSASLVGHVLLDHV